jgi:hypothetical protein
MGSRCCPYLDLFSTYHDFPSLLRGVPKLLEEEQSVLFSHQSRVGLFSAATENNKTKKPRPIP